MREVLGDYLKNLFGRLLALLAGAVGVIVTIVSFIIGGWPLRWAGIILLILAYMVANFWAWADMRSKRDQVAKERDEARTEIDEARRSVVTFEPGVFWRFPPHIVATVQTVDERGQLSQPVTKLEPSPELFLVKVRNDPNLRLKAAELPDAEITLRFYSLPSWELDVECDGTWLENDPPAAAKSLDPIRRRRLPANGKLHEIAVAVKYPGEHWMYAHDPRLLLSPQGRNERYQLTSPSYAVAVRVGAQALAQDAVAWFQLDMRTDGKAQFGVATDQITTAGNQL